MPTIAVILDRDGTVNEEAGYLNHPSRFKLIPGVAQAIRKLNRKKILVIVATNQSGVGRGFFTEEVLERIHRKMKSLLRKRAAHIDKIYYCPHRPEDRCSCRKPKSGMLRKVKKDFDLDLKKCFIVGDKYKDILWAKKAGAKGILVLTGYGKGEYEYQRKDWEKKPDFVAKDLRSAVDWILSYLAAK